MLNTIYVEGHNYRIKGRSCYEYSLGMNTIDTKFHEYGRTAEVADRLFQGGRDQEGLALVP